MFRPINPGNRVKHPGMAANDSGVLVDVTFQPNYILCQIADLKYVIAKERSTIGKLYIHIDTTREEKEFLASARPSMSEVLRGEIAKYETEALTVLGIEHELI